MKFLFRAAKIHSLPKHHDWNQAVLKAGTLVGNPISALSCRSLLSNDVSGLESHFHKLVGSDHPVLPALKRMIFQDVNRFQIRGLISLLWSRSTNPKVLIQEFDYMPEYGLLERQRKLGEIIEMIYSGQILHKSVLNLPNNLASSSLSSLQDHLRHLDYGNKIAILAGDYLLAQASLKLAELRNTDIVECISISIAEFTQSEFLNQKDVHGYNVPNSETISIESWMNKNKLAWAGLIANGCKTSNILAKHSEEMLKTALAFGYHVGLALQAQTELLPFIDETIRNGSFDLTSAPAIFHFQQNSELLNYVLQEGAEDLSSLNFKKIIKDIQNGPGIQMTKDFICHQVSLCLEILKTIEDNDGKSALTQLIKSLKN